MRIRLFSLIELLITISVIAILAALIMPALNKARESARGIHCTSNMKQIGTAAVQYADNNNDWLFSGYYNKDAHSYFLPLALAPYYGIRIKSYAAITCLTKFLRCPSDNKTMLNSEDLKPYEIATNYQLTVVSRSGGTSWIPEGATWGGGHGKINDYLQKRFRQITPGSVYCAESYAYKLARDDYEPAHGLVPSYNLNEKTTNDRPGASDKWGYLNSASFIHNLRSSFLFVDGHVSRLKLGVRFNENWQLK